MRALRLQPHRHPGGDQVAGRQGHAGSEPPGGHAGARPLAVEPLRPRCHRVARRIERARSHDVARSRRAAASRRAGRRAPGRHPRQRQRPQGAARGLHGDGARGRRQGRLREGGPRLPRHHPLGMRQSVPAAYAGGDVRHAAGELQGDLQEAGRPGVFAADARSGLRGDRKGRCARRPSAPRWF